MTLVFFVYGGFFRGRAGVGVFASVFIVVSCTECVCVCECSSCILSVIITLLILVTGMDYRSLEWE